MTVTPRRMETGFADEAQRPARKLPLPILFVGLFQCLKAAFILFLALKFARFGAGIFSSDKTTFGEFIVDGLLLIAGLAAFYFASLGIRLIRLDKEARRTLMWNILAGWLLFGVSFNGLFFGQGPAIEAWPKRTFICVLLIDIFLYCCLAYYPNVAESFGEKDDAGIF